MEYDIVCGLNYRRFYIMRSKSAKLFLIFSCLFLFGFSLFGARFVIVAPGQTYTNGVGISGAPVNQVDGVPFNVSVVALTDAATAPSDGTTFPVTMTCATSSIITPANTFQLNQILASSVPNSLRYPVTVTFNSGVAGSPVLFANPSGSGPTAGNVTITCQVLSKFSFTAIASPQTAGSVIAITITAQNAANATVTGFNGTANLSANYPITGSVSLGQIQFTNGVYTGLITLYDAIQPNITLTCASTVPSVSSNSGAFRVNPGTLTSLLIIGPGQTYVAGTNGGTGRAVTTSAVLSQQTAGSYFYVTVYAVDAYWNTAATNCTIALSTTDPNFVFTPSSAASGVAGQAIFKVELRTVGSGTQSLSASTTGSPAAATSVVTVPMTYTGIDHFNVTQAAPVVIAGENFLVHAVAVDLFNNTITTFASTAAVSFYAGVDQLTAGHAANQNANFSGGVANFYAAIYKKITSATIKLTYNTTSGTSNVFDVTSSDFTKLLFVATGQTYDWGYSNSNLIVTGIPTTATAGAQIAVDIYATDDYGNQIGAVNDAVSLTTSDTFATINGVSQTATINLSGGKQTYHVIFQTGGTQTLNGTDTSTSGITDATIPIVVQASTISYFEVANVPVSVVAGHVFQPILRAKDQFGNTKTDYSGIVYLSANTDYTLPSETTIQISGTGNGAGAYFYKWAVTFTASDSGERTLSGYLYRAATFTAKIFASDNFNDTPFVHTGKIGTSSGCTVNSGTAVKLQVLPPGMEARPGTADGENNTPTGQAKDPSTFTSVVNLVDPYWNIVTGRTDQINVNTSDSSNSLINGTAPGSTGVPVFLNSATGSQSFTTSYSNESASFQIKVEDGSVPSMTLDWSPYISIFQIDHFSIRQPGNTAIATQTAGVPFQISITAYSAVGVIATGFNGNVQLSSSNDYLNLAGIPEYTINPTQSISFTNGIAVMSITMYRASTSADQGQITIKAKFGTRQDQSNSFDLNANVTKGILVLVDGESHKPGLANTEGWGYYGYDGSPSTKESGFASGLKVYYVDQYFNIVYSHVSTNLLLTSTDSNASLNGAQLIPGPVRVAVVGGVYTTTNGLVLRTCGPTGNQTVTITDDSGIPGALGSHPSDPIPIKHTTFDHFSVVAPAGPVIAGVPFNINLQALDINQNLCDDINGGIPFNKIANLTANTGANTMWPTTYQLSKGTAVASVQLFQAPNTNVNITAENTGLTGVSDSIITAPDSFKRLLITTTGMARKNGVFTTAVQPLTFTMYDVTMPPFSASSNQTKVNDASNLPNGYTFNIYSCDAYGNITATTDVIGQTLTVTTNDPYALPVTLTAIDSVSGQVSVSLVFHKAAPGIVVSASITNPLIQTYTTPSFTTLPGTTYGLQLMVPGLSVDGGSGYYDNTFLTWANGITGTPKANYSGVPFYVTVQTCDIYGNVTNDISHHVRITSTAPAPSFPTVGANTFNGNLGQPDVGISTCTAVMTTGSPQYINMLATDLDDVTMNKTWSIPVNIYITNGGSLEYAVFAASNTWTASAAYTPYGTDGTNSVNATAAPSKFGFKVTVIDNVSHSPVNGVSNNFICEPVAYPDFNTVLPGTLGIQNGTTSGGEFITTNQSYTVATKFRIRVSDLNPTPANRLAPKYSPIIDMAANTNNVILTVGVRNDTGFHTGVFNARSGVTTPITGNLVDQNGNNLVGYPIRFDVVKGSGKFAGNSISVTASTVNGDAEVDFYGAYVNENCLIKATYNSFYSYVTIAVSIVDPVSGQVSNYPNPFKAGAESTSISYLLDANADVKITVYTLFGDMVFTKSISSGQPGAVGGMVNNYLWDGKNTKGSVVGNGGYICIVETTVKGAKKKMVRKIAVAK
jgi:hypothetical protein